MGSGGGDGDQQAHPLLGKLSESSSYGSSDEHLVKRTGTVWTAMAHIITAVIGSGVLSLAWSVAQLGWAGGPAAMVFFAGVTAVQSTLIADCYISHDPERGVVRNRSYVDAVRLYLGEKSHLFFGFFLNFSLFGTGVVYTLTSATSMSFGKRMIWNHVYEKGLIDVMHEHKDNPRFKGQNGWNRDGWNSITTKFNEMFPLANFSKKQLQEKEGELKGYYKAIRDTKNESGVGWNDTLCMVLAEAEVWPRLIRAHPKVARFRNRPFPLYYSLEGLYEGSVATGELNFTSTAADRAPPSVPSSRSASEQSINPLSTNSLGLDGQETTSMLNLSTDAQSAPDNTNEPTEAHFVPSNQESSQREGGSGRKRKQSHVGSALESYVEFKKIHATETLEALKEKKRQEEQFSISKCQDVLKVMDGLTAEEKSYALELFESTTNREVFLTTAEHNVD